MATRDWHNKFTLQNCPLPSQNTTKTHLNYWQETHLLNCHWLLFFLVCHWPVSMIISVLNIWKICMWQRMIEVVCTIEGQTIMIRLERSARASAVAVAILCQCHVATRLCQWHHSTRLCQWHHSTRLCQWHHVTTRLCQWHHVTTRLSVTSCYN